MSHFMRRHRRGILIGIIIFIGIPFVFFVPGIGSIGGNSDMPPGYPEVVAQVGDRPISSLDFRAEYDRISRARAQDGVFPTAEQLTQDGTVERILESLINSALLGIETDKRDYTAAQDYLEEMLKELPQFQTPEGEFDAAYYNQWVQGNDGANWNGIYEELDTMLDRQLFGTLVSSSVRVSESDLRQQFLDANTKIRVKYLGVEPEVELTEEELKEHYETNIDSYKTAEERTAEFVAVSLEAPLPPVTDDIMTRAHAGEDFTELVKEFSEGPQKANGGDLGFLTNTAALPDHQKAVFNMAIGQIGDPIRGPAGVHIYKVTEKRDSTLAGMQDVRVQEILLRPQLSEEEKQARRDRAQALIDAATESGDLKAAAEADGLDYGTTGAFSRTSTAIGEIDTFDVFAFRRDVIDLDPESLSGIIEGRNNLYVARVAEIIEPKQQDFDEVRERVETDAIAAYKRTPEYLAAVDQYVTDIQEKAQSLDQIQELFPELNATISETVEPFSRTDFLFQQGARFQATDAFAAVDDKEQGELAGPLTDFSGVTYFVALEERIEPDETMWEEQWPVERETLRTQSLMAKQFEHQEDYFQFLRERAAEQALIQENWTAIAQIIDYGGGATETESPIEATNTPGEPAELGPVDADSLGATDAENSENAEVTASDFAPAPGAGNPPAVPPAAPRPDND